MVEDVSDLADDVRRGGAHGQADEVVVAELVGVIRRRRARGVDAQPGTAQFAGRRAVVEARRTAR